MRNPLALAQSLEAAVRNSTSVLETATHVRRKHMPSMVAAKTYFAAVELLSKLALVAGGVGMLLKETH
jgi:hypothetical protein